jgi:hypothetical protein
MLTQELWPVQRYCNRESQKFIAKMDSRPAKSSRRRPWRLALLLLVVVALLPEIAIYLITAAAKIKGCEVTQETACMIYNVPLSGLIARALTAEIWIASTGIPMGWVLLCYLAITLGWRHLGGRICMGLIVTCVFGVLYFPAVSIAHLVNPKKCMPNHCMIFGGDVFGTAYGVGQNDLMEVAIYMLLAFLAYAVLAILIGLFSAQRPTGLRQ